MTSANVTSAGDQASAVTNGLAEVFWRAAAVVLALMPLGMALAHRSSPVFIVLAALCCLVALTVEGRLKTFLNEAASVLTRPLGLAVLAFLAWCLASVAWSELKVLSLRALGEFLLPLASAFVLALSLPSRMTKGGLWVLALSFLAACAIIVIDLRSGLMIRHALGARAENFVFNRSVITLAVLAAPLVAWLSGQFRLGNGLALAGLFLLAGTVFLSASGAAVLGLGVACLAFPFAWLWPRLARWIAVAGFVTAMAAAPFIGVIGTSLIPPSAHKQMATGHSQERVRLWTSFGLAVREQPVIGAGFGVSARMQETQVAAQVPAQHRPMLAIGHPHNAMLQIWAELGLVGVALALGVILLALAASMRTDRLTASLSLALIAGAAAIAYVGHGAWQGWWVASLGAAVIWMRAASLMRPET